MYLYKSNHKGISFEFILPKKDSYDMVLILPGLPEYPRPKEFMEFLAKKGYGVLYLRYRGTFESEGKFLSDSPAYDVLEIIDMLSKEKKITELYNNTDIKNNPKNLHIMASSFGASVALHLSKLTKKIKSYILIAPILDFKKHNVLHKEQNLENMERFLKKAFPNVYRFKSGGYSKLLKGEIIPSAFEGIKKISGKLTIFHGKKDAVVSIKNTYKFKEVRDKLNLIELENEGHIPLLNLEKKLLIKILVDEEN